MQIRDLLNLDNTYCKYFSALSNCQSKGWLTIDGTPSRRPQSAAQYTHKTLICSYRKLRVNVNIRVKLNAFQISSPKTFLTLLNIWYKQIILYFIHNVYNWLLRPSVGKRFKIINGKDKWHTKKNREIKTNVLKQAGGDPFVTIDIINSNSWLYIEWTQSIDTRYNELQGL